MVDVTDLKTTMERSFTGSTGSYVFTVRVKTVTYSQRSKPTHTIIMPAHEEYYPDQAKVLSDLLLQAVQYLDRPDAV